MNFFRTQMSRIANSSSATRCWLFVVAVYIIIYGGLLLKTDGLPYVIDNNESFSSFWHARSLYENGVAKTKGLADEVFAWHVAASPYVHTHQGNFPRLFAYLLYALGARSIESQIWLTTFTAGLAAILLAYRFLRTIGPPLFAALACLVMMTDYALFAQWQINTYRVWYGFFFFSSLLCVQSLDKGASKSRILLIILNFAALFYGEYVFGLYVGLLCALYALIRYFWRPRAIATAWFAIAAGGVIAATVLLAQLTAYMGWANVKLDISYTLQARNMASNAEFANEVNAFYKEHNVIFWQNYLDTTNLKSAEAFFTSLFQRHLQFYGPWLCLCALIVLAGWLAGLIGRISGSKTRRANTLSGSSDLNSATRPPSTWGEFSNQFKSRYPLIFAFVLVLGTPRRWHFISIMKAVVLMCAAYFFLDVLSRQINWVGVREFTATAQSNPSTVVVLKWSHTPKADYKLEIKEEYGSFRTLGSTSKDEHMVGDLAPNRAYQFRIHRVTNGRASVWRAITLTVQPGAQAHAYDWPVTALLFITTILLVLLLSQIWTGHWFGLGRLRWLRIIFGAALFLAAASLMETSNKWFDADYQNMWQGALPSSVPSWFGYVAYFVTTLFAVALSVLGVRHISGRQNSLAGLVTLSLCALCAYIVTYSIFTGYIYSGYLYRQAPFLVYWTDILLGAVLFLAWAGMRRQLVHGTMAFTEFGAQLKGFGSSRKRRPSDNLALLRSALHLSPLLLGGVLLLAFAGAWFGLQGDYLRLIPPNAYSFLKQLAAPPYKKASFVANTYPAPIAAKTGSWAYAESSLLAGTVLLDAEGYHPKYDDKYLWFADAASNRAYLKPDYGIMIVQPASIYQALQIFIEQNRAKANSVPQVKAGGLVKRAESDMQPFLQHRLVASDGLNYSIVRFDWNFPPFLQPVDENLRTIAGTLTIRQKLALSQEGKDVQHRLRIEIEPMDSDSALDKPTDILLVSATVDAKPIFSTNTMQSAGWMQVPHPGDMRSYVWSAAQAQRNHLPLINITSGGDQVQLRFLQTPRGGKARVTINDLSQVIDLRAGPIKEVARQTPPKTSRLRAKLNERPTEALGEKVITFSTAQPHGKYTSVPNFLPGIYVHTSKRTVRGQPFAEISYKYTHQEGVQEAATTVRLYEEISRRKWLLVDAVTFLGSPALPVRLAEFRRSNPDTVAAHAKAVAGGDRRSYEQWLTDHLAAHPQELARPGIVNSGRPSDFSPSQLNVTGVTTRRIPLPVRSGRFQLSVAPGTATKSGPEYFGLVFSPVGAVPAPEAPDPLEITSSDSANDSDLPFGQLRLKLRFPTNRWPQSEPIVTTGSNEAGDILYVIYEDAGHIRLGFDHWFKGGPRTKPIAVDFSRGHDLDISIGSLFPSSEDIVFADIGPAEVAGVKNRILIKLDGVAVIDSEGTCYDSSPEQVTVGQNTISGTSCGPKFTGEIISIERVWPDLK